MVISFPRYVRGCVSFSPCSMVADMAVESTGIDKDFFMQNLWDYQGQTVRAWKYGATSKAVCDTVIVR